MKKVQNIMEKLKKWIKIIAFSFLCFLTVAALVVSLILTSVAFTKPNENTAQIFGYKIFCADNDISKTEIKKDSLVIIKNSDNDLSYTPEYISENAVLIIPNGALLVKDSTLVVLSVMSPVILMFLLVILTEIRKSIINRSDFNREIVFDLSEKFDEDENEDTYSTAS